MEIKLNMHCETCDEDFEPEKIFERYGDIVLYGTHAKCGVTWEETYEFDERIIV